MSFDCSRVTFDPWDDYLGVVMQQGRVQLDSDWNEWLSEFARRIQAGALDTMGRAAYPKQITPFAFQITASVNNNGANTIAIGPGRMYVDGLLAENHGARASAQWDPALAELSGSPQPPAKTPTGTTDFTAQPYYPGATVPGTGTFLLYLDVWIRDVTYLEHRKLIDKAVAVDTTGRLQTVWQVKSMSAPAGTTCKDLGSLAGWPPAPSAGRLTTKLVPSASTGPCCLNAATGYTGMENQLYRVEIHETGVSGKAGAAETACFKWSRNNASVGTRVTAITTTGITNSAGTAAVQLTVESLGRDQVLGFSPGDWIEILDNDLELTGQSGELHKIDTVDPTGLTITLVDTLLTPGNFPVTGVQTDPKRHTRITQWNQTGQISSVDGSGNKTNYFDLDSGDLGKAAQGAIPVPPPGTVLLLENGITVSFDLSPAGGAFNEGDFWEFAARTADASVEILTEAPPRGIFHHYAPLSVVVFDGTTKPTFSDCRTPWPPACEGDCGCCCTYTVGSDAKYKTIQSAVDAIHRDKGGEICIQPGRYYENVVIHGKRDIVLRGCGWQTRIASASLQPPGGLTVVAPEADTKPGTNLGSSFSAVITIVDSEHIQLLSFAVEAAPGDVGILVDGTGNLYSNILNVRGAGQTTGAEINNNASLAIDPQAYLLEENMGVVDLTIKDLLITSTDQPAIMADFARVLFIDNNRIAVGNVRSLFSAVYVRGAEIHVDNNWIGILDAANLLEWFPDSVRKDLLADAKNYVETLKTAYEDFKKAGLALHPGGIQVAGPSADVYIRENEIEGGARNGITLGNLEILQTEAPRYYYVMGVLQELEGPCSKTGTLQVGGGVTGGSKGESTGAGGRLINIQIARNRICDMGLCGIGPVGYFDLSEIAEIISINGLTIEDNTITDTLERAVADVIGKNITIGYGAICVPDVENLIIRDNTITNFGESPGANVSGIYVLHGEVVEISRNQVLENRDWNEGGSDMTSDAATQGGILIPLVTPPTLAVPRLTNLWVKAAAGAANQPTYTPTLPALRVEHNVVRVPLGLALAVVGLGPFTIVNNHFATGGTVVGEGDPLLAQTVLILNLGTPLESNAIQSFTGAYGAVKAGFVKAPNSFSSSGAVLFANNICQLENQFDAQDAFASVLIFSLDHLLFSNNHCWVDTSGLTAFVDAFLFGITVQMTGNRLQEQFLGVVLSGWSLGLANITTQNMTTNCLVATAIIPTMRVKRDNLPLIAAAGGDDNPCSVFSVLEKL